MPAKGCDDYITARAANPRTGLVTPSVSGTPCTPRTPTSPAEALELYSPLLAIGASQPSLPGKVQVECPRMSISRWRSDDKGCWMETTIAEPRRTALMRKDAGLADVVPKESLHGARPQQPPYPETDRFAILMPTARDPQPFVFKANGTAMAQGQVNSMFHRKPQKAPIGVPCTSLGDQGDISPVKSTRAVELDATPPSSPTPPAKKTFEVSQKRDGTLRKIARKPVGSLLSNAVSSHPQRSASSPLTSTHKCASRQPHPASLAVNAVLVPKSSSRPQSIDSSPSRLQGSGLPRTKPRSATLTDIGRRDRDLVVSTSRSSSKKSRKSPFASMILKGVKQEELQLLFWRAMKVLFALYVLLAAFQIMNAIVKGVEAALKPLKLLFILLKWVGT